LIVASLFGWLEREQRDVIEFLWAENRILKTQLHGRRMRLHSGISSERSDPVDGRMFHSS
jgi:hypothetical protein